MLEGGGWDDRKFTFAYALVDAWCALTFAREPDVNGLTDDKVVGEWSGREAVGSDVDTPSECMGSPGNTTSQGRNTWNT